MGTECILTKPKDDAEVMPPVPPGFVSLTSFKLQKVQDERDKDCSIDGSDKFRKSLRHRPWVNYCMPDNSSDEEAAAPEMEKDMPSRNCLPKGVIRGCAECRNCQKVMARWKPEKACRPFLDNAPVFYPTEEEFKDTIKYIESIRPKAEPYGVCRIVPPCTWRPPGLLKEKNLWESSKFCTRVQQIDKLQNRRTTGSVYPNYSVMRRKKRKLLKMEGTSDELAEANELGHDNSTEAFGFEPGPDFTLHSFQKYADYFREQYFKTDMNSNQTEPSLDSIEGEYWRIVEKPTEEIEVLYGADLHTTSFGSGFPGSSSTNASSELEDQCMETGWNLNNLPRAPGSVLRYETAEIPGVLVPWLYVGMCFSSFCWHVEDHHLYSLNYLHLGAPKVWYGVAGKDAVKLEAAMKKHLPDLFKKQPDLLHNLVTQFSPSLLKQEGIPVYRCVQSEGEFVLTFPRAYHSGFNSGFNCAEAVNVAPLDWLPHGQIAVELYREQKRKITLSHDKLLLSAAREAVRAQWNILFLRKDTVDNLRWKNSCGTDGILTRSLKARIAVEQPRRDYLCSSSGSRKMDAGFDASERECVVCYYDLHLSAVGCPSCRDRFACLIHAKQLCSCPWSTRLFLFRYEISELYLLVDALVGKLSAVHRWAISDLGLSLSSCISKERAQPSANRASKEGCQETPDKQINIGNLTGLVRTSDLSKLSKVSMLEAAPPSEVRRTKELNDAISSKNQEPCVRAESLSNIVEDKNIESTGGSTSSVSSSTDSSGQSGFSDGMKSTGSSSSELAKGFYCDSPAIKPVKMLLPASREKSMPHKSFSDEKRNDLSLERSKTTAKLIVGDGKTTIYNCSENTNAFVANKNSSGLPSLAEKSSNTSNLELVKSNINDNGKSKNDLPHPNQLFVRDSSETPPVHTKTANVSISGSPNLLVPREACAINSTENTQFQGSQLGGGEKAHNESIGRKTALLYDCDMVDRVNPAGTSPSYAQNLFDSCNRLQKGPRIAKVVRRFNSTVEPLEYGVVLQGKLWSTALAIFPKGYRSRVKYFSILDPTAMCYYISEILDPGLFGPLFMVTVEQCPSEVFIQISATRCWDMVRERVNQEIRRQHSMGKSNSATLQPPGSIDGLEMFGLTSPAIVEAIEALDRHRLCTEYWNSRPGAQAIPSSVDPRPSSAMETSSAIAPACTIFSVALRGLFKKANPEELRALASMLDDGLPRQQRQEAILLLNEEIGSRQL